LSASTPERGDVWLAAFDPVAPITTRRHGFSHHVPITGGLDRPSFARPEYMRSIVQRRLRRRLGAAELASVAAVTDWLRRIASL
jgi:mRNA-degrading endonuclease toxin of MazEF toxin-antitoxin module